MAHGPSLNILLMSVPGCFRSETCSGFSPLLVMLFIPAFMASCPTIASPILMTSSVTLTTVLDIFKPPPFYGSVHEPVLNQRPERQKPLLPGDLLALFILPTGIGDGHLVDAYPFLKYLGRNLRLEVEAVRFYGDPLQRPAPEHLIAGLHVGNGRIVEDVGCQRQ